MKREVIIKKEKFLQMLKDVDMDDAFEVLDIDEADISAFKTIQSIQNSHHANIIVAFDENIWNQCVIEFAKLDNPNKKEQILELLNMLNCEDKVVKYRLLEGRIEAVITLGALGEDFDARFFLSMILQAFQRLKDDVFKRVMRILWS